MSTPKRSWHVTALEWLAYDAIVEADSEDEAHAKAERIWAAKSELDVFTFRDSGLDGLIIVEL